MFDNDLFESALRDNSVEKSKKLQKVIYIVMLAVVVLFHTLVIGQMLKFYPHKINSTV